MAVLQTGLFDLGPQPLIDDREDDTIVRLTLCEFLEEAGLQVFEAGDAEGALALLETPAHGITVLVTDLDNVMWHGVIGEDGVEVMLGHDAVLPRVRSTTGLQVTVRGLKKKRSYSMFVRAFNRVGVSPWVRAQVSTRR